VKRKARGAAPEGEGTKPPRDLLLEIGVEELPARFVAPALEGLAAAAREAFEEKGLSFAAVRTLGTPRRLALLVDGLAAMSREREERSLGPAVAQAKDAQGNWTPAAQGFARSQGTTPEKLEAVKSEKGERLCAVKRHPGVPAKDLLPDLLPGLVRRVHFAKNMVWEPSRFSFARPVRWLVALFGTDVVKFELAGVKSGRKTCGLRVHGTKPVDVPAPAKYVSLLRDRLVVVDAQERRGLIEKQIQQTVKSAGGRVDPADGDALLDEVVQLVEHPVAVLGKFDPRHLALPPEVLVTSMKKHQKFFPVRGTGKDGELLPCFIGIRNGVSENQAVVREGYERVLAARLADAAFFHEQDRRTKLEDKAPSLKSVLFQKELGSVWDKTERVIQLVGTIAAGLGLERETAHAAPRIAYLAKADLVTAVVGEFPELQGVMGRIYALADGEPGEVAQGIEQQYWPLTAEGELPRTASAAVASVADKLDTLAGDFHVGLVPTGSQDPYGLRRAAVGTLRVLSERGWRVDLPRLVDAALAPFPGGDRAKTAQLLMDFFRQRWAALQEARGFRFDEVQSVQAGGFADPVDAEKRLQALQSVRRHPDFTPLAVAFKRASNILSQARKKNGGAPVKTEVDEALFREPAEKSLFEAYGRVSGVSTPLLDAQSYDQALREMVGLKAPVDEFFSKVMVMAPEPELAANRLALLAGIEVLFLRVADLSCLHDVPAAPSR
jgi:glycyl-tRNA synthetase beta chain